MLHVWLHLHVGEGTRQNESKVSSFAVVELPCKVHVVEKAGSSSISSTSYMHMGVSGHNLST